MSELPEHPNLALPAAESREEPPQPPSAPLDKPPSPPPAAAAALSPPPPPRFDPSRMIGIIRRKALVKDLAAVYHAECLAYCQELLELQRKWEPIIDVKTPEESRKETMRPPKRLKKAR